MKKISKGYYIAAALLVICAVVDFYHYATIGQDLVVYYSGENIIRELVQDQLFQGIVKVLLAAGIIAFGFMRARTGKRLSSLTAITLRLGALVLAFWLGAMALLTWGTAQYEFERICNTGLELGETVGMCSELDRFYDSGYDRFDDSFRTPRLPGTIENWMNYAIRAFRTMREQRPNMHAYDADKEIPDIFRQKTIDMETAVIFLDKDGEIIRSSGNFVYFQYVSEEKWKSGEDTPIDGCGWVDIGDGSDPRYSIFHTMWGGAKSLHDLDAIRLTGYWDGSRFEPYAMAFLMQGTVMEAVESIAPPLDESYTDITEESVIINDDGSATVSASGGTGITYSWENLDAQGLLTWDERFDNMAEYTGEKELVTIYAEFPDICVYETEGPVRYRETEEYDNLLELLKTMTGYDDSGRNAFYGGASQFSMSDLIVFSSWAWWDLSEYDPAVGLAYPDAEITLLTALRASPLKIAMSFLRNVYIVTFLISLLAFFLIRSGIKKNLIEPLRAVNNGISNGWSHISATVEQPAKWAESYELEAHYRDTQDQLRMKENEITRLNTALQYAKTAEENRRQMTSNIAHELKTPLAVIHSYAEGLKEHIAEDKREKYLDTILSEAERTDGMVLEMLDLSRLEAGKVKLSRDDFSLIELTRKIFEKLEIPAQEKNLRIEFHFPDDFTVTADESRIAQVVENFATNALKYTPDGGHVSVKIQTSRTNTMFSIENDSEPLSSEALSKVWDTFYRTDQARSGGGTGLGLAIAKNIIELHGGKCSVRNTDGGVEFGFTLPN